MNDVREFKAAERRPAFARTHVARDREVGILTFHEIADARSFLETELYFTEGELSPTREVEWDRLSGKARDKVYRFGLWACEQEALIGAVDHEIERLTERRRVVERRLASRKPFIAEFMAKLGLRVVEGPLCTITLQKNSSVSVEQLAPASAGPQSDLFASRSSEAHSTRTGSRAVRGSHVRVR